MPIGQLSKGTAKSELSYSQDQRQEVPLVKTEMVSEQSDSVDKGSLAPRKCKPLLQLSGFDFNSIDQGVIRVRAPLVGGKFGIPGPFADAVIKVRNFAVAQLNIGIGKENGKTIIEGANITFQPPIKIKNPASAFKPSKNKIVDVDFLKDKLADIYISAIHVGKNGQIHIDGYLKASIFGKKDLNKLIPKGSLPKIDLNLEGLAKHSSPTNSAFNLEKLLTAVGAVVQEASFTIEAHAEPRQVTLKTRGIQAWTDKSSAQANLHGRLALTRQNSVHINIDQDRSVVHFDDGQAHVGGEIRISDISKKNPSVQSHLSYKVDALPVHAQLKFSKDEIDIELPAGKNRISGHAFVFRDENGHVTLKDASSISVHVDGHVPNDLQLRNADMQASVSNGIFNADIRANLSVDSDGPTISAGEAKASLGAKDLQSNLKGISISAPGDYYAQLSANRVAFTPQKGFPSAKGNLTFGMNPSASTIAIVPEMLPFQSIFNFDLQDDATLKIDFVQKGLTEFLRPFTDVVLKERHRQFVPGVDCSPIGSSNFRRRCEDIGNAKIRKNNSVELLVDGKTSLPKRLEIINGATKSICMQTMVLKDDDTGGQIADALCDAVKRGVKVRVIVDALGNCASLMDLVAMNPIYSRLKSGGVELEIQNNSLGEGIRKVLNALSKSKEISTVFKFEDFSDPKKVFSILNTLANIALGELKLDFKDEERKELTAGLTQILSGGKEEHSIDLVKELAGLTKDNVLELSEFVNILKRNAHLNFRWHEKYLIADQATAIVGGLNSADEYLLGGTPTRVTVRGREGEAWRDTDICINGDAAKDAFTHFAANWTHLGREEISVEDTTTETPAGDYRVQMVHSRPRIDSDSNILNLMVESLGSLQAGEKAFIENAYFLPTGRAQDFEDALVSASRRGVDVRVLMNSKDTLDVKPVAEGAVFSQRRLLQEGIRIFERVGERMMHSKVAVFGGKVAVVGSWNADNRSSSLNSESAALIHSNRFSRKIESMISDDMKEGNAREIQLKDIAYLPVQNEIKNAMRSMMSDLL